MTVEKAVQEVMRLHKSLPARPGIEEVEAARSLIQSVEREDELKLERISQPSAAKDVPEELLAVLQEMQRNLIHFQSKEQKKDAQKLLDLESAHLVFDELIQRASVCLKSNISSKSSKSKSASSSSLQGYASSSTAARKVLPPPSLPAAAHEQPLRAKDDSFFKKPPLKTSLDLDNVRSRDVLAVPTVVDSTLRPGLAHGELVRRLFLRLIESFVVLMSELLFLLQVRR